MAEEKLQFTLELATRQTGDGAKRMTEDLAALKRQVADTAEKVRVNEFAFYDLDAAMGKTRRGSETFTAGTTQLKKSTANASQSLFLFSQGFEDAQYGIRGVLNNIPSLILAMGGTAGLAGALSIAAVAGSTLYSWLTKVEEKSGDTEQRIKEFADAAGQFQADKFQGMIDGVTNVAEAAAAVKQNWNLTEAAQASAATATLTNAEKITSAEKLIAEALGLQVDRYREIEQIAARQAAARELQAQQEIKRELDKVKAANELADTKIDFLSKQRENALQAEFDLRRDKARLLVLQKQEEELKKQAATLKSFGGRLLDSFTAAQASDGATPARGLPGQNDQAAAAAAAAKLAPGSIFNADLQSTLKRVEAIEGELKGLTKDGGIIARAENAANRAITDLRDTESAVSTKIEEIGQTFNASDLQARAQTVVDKGKALAEALKGAMETVQTNTAEGAAAKEGIQQAAKDGKITADEIRELTKNLTTLTGKTQAGLATVDGGVNRLIDLQTKIIELGASWDSRLKTLENQVRDLGTRR